MSGSLAKSRIVHGNTGVYKTGPVEQFNANANAMRLGRASLIFISYIRELLKKGPYRLMKSID